MVTRRGVLLGVGALAVGAGGVLGTGAFTSVQAQRAVSVQTAGDADALLGLDTISGSPNSADYASITGGTLEVSLDGVNLNAVTHIDRVFQITNNGPDPVVLYLEERPGSDNPGGNSIDIGTRTNQLDGVTTVGGNDQPSSDGISDDSLVDLSRPGGPDEGGVGYDEIGVKLDPGESLEVGVYVDTSDENLNDGLGESGDSDIGANELLLEELVVYASVAAAENGEWAYEAA